MLNVNKNTIIICTRYLKIIAIFSMEILVSFLLIIGLFMIKLLCINSGHTDHKYNIQNTIVW